MTQPHAARPSLSGPATLTAALLVLLGVAPFLRSLSFGFAYDDVHTVLRHPGVRAFSLRDVFGRDFWGVPLGSAESLGSYRPFATLSLAVDAKLGGGAPFVFHLTNLLLYAATLALSLRFLERFAGDELSPRARSVVVGVFATLAIHVEVVTNATGRAELLAMLATLGALVVALRDEPRVRDHVAYAALLVLAFGSKESTWPIALLAPLLLLRRKRRPIATLAIGLVVLAAAIAFRAATLRFVRLDPQMAIDNPLVSASFPARVVGAMDVLARYVAHAATGVDLCPDYGYACFVPGRPALVAIAGFFIAALMVLALVRGRRALGDAVIAFGAVYAVVSHVILPASVLLADRVFFFPSFFLIVIVALAVAPLARLQRLFFVAACAFAAVQALLAFLGSGAWRDDRTLAIHAITTCPNTERSWILRLDAARAGREVQEGAFAALAAAAIHRRRPHPIDGDLIPEGLVERPHEERLQRMRERLGAEYPAVLEVARGLLVGSRFPEAMAALH